MSEAVKTLNYVLAAIFGLAVALLIFGHLDQLTTAIQGSAQAATGFLSTFKS
jgi:hypothetical protein